MGDTVVIKDVDQAAFRILKGEAAKEGLKIGEAASQAFRLWVQQKALKRVKDAARIKAACKRIDENRAKLKPVRDWNSVKEIRKWRKYRHSL